MVSMLVVVEPDKKNAKQDQIKIFLSNMFAFN